VLQTTAHILETEKRLGVEGDTVQKPLRAVK